MSGAKASLKAAKAALDAQEYERAAAAANKAIDRDAKSYHGYVFLGLALDKQSQPEASEKAYSTAISMKEDDVLAWQGLVSLYEKNPSKMLDKYHDATLRLADLYERQDDKIKCQTVVDKYMIDAKKYGSRKQFKRSLEVILPESSIFDFLEGRIPQPAHTYSKLADIIEAEEKEKINHEIGQRRTRLGARIDQVTLEVKREVLQDSRLGSIYSKVVDWSQDDDVRRTYEEKQLQYAGDTLAALPMAKKSAECEKVMKMANGLVILKHPFLLAWKIVLEWQDLDDVANMDASLLRDFVSLFPNEGLSKVCRGYILSEISSFAKDLLGPVDAVDEEAVDSTMPAEDRLILMTEGLQDASKSILAHRLMAQYYLYLDEYESAVHTSRNGLRRVTAESDLTGLSLVKTTDAINSTLASALIHYQAPRHHAEARAIFEAILSRNPADTSALVGVGLIYEEQEDYAEALSSLNQSLERSLDPRIRAEAAWCKALMGNNHAALQQFKASLSEMDGSDPKTKSLRAQTLYRIGMCLWQIDTSRPSRKDRNGPYAHFLASLQADMNFAPAYTILGIFYADYAKDRKRARKCFHKAFELSASETEAAYRLAESFAQASEWESVEAIAQRVIDSGKTKPPPGSKKKAISWPYAALGVVQLNNQEYAKSIVSFQLALRASPNDYHCWVGLAESYHNSGRYMSATKAFEHAKQLVQSSETEGWFTEYMLANVRRELGDYDESLEGYRNVLKKRPNEFGVSLALLQTLVESAWHGIELAIFGRAAEQAKEAITAAQTVASIRNNAFNVWKAVGDACSIFVEVQGYASLIPWRELISLLEQGSEPSSFDQIADLDNVTSETLATLHTSNQVEIPASSITLAAILAYKRAISASAHDVHAKAVAWYNLGWAEYKAHRMSQAAGAGPGEARHLKAAVQCFKRAIELEAGNAEFWNALGIATCDLNPRVAQHSFVRSLYLNDKNARLWTNLGTLFLLQDDRQLASEAFTRAQSTDPDYAQAWLCQGLLATKAHSQAEARDLFTHAFEIANSSSTLIKSLYSTATFDHIDPSRTNASDLLQPLLSLHHLLLQVPYDTAPQQLAALFAERVRKYENALTSLESICAGLEADYESSESSLTLARFALAKSDIARMHLAQGNFENAAEDAMTALDLTDDEEQTVSRHEIRLSAHMTAGLAYFNQKSNDESIDMFKSALTETQDNADIICLLAQTLWAKEDKSEQDVAREQLLDCIERNPGHVNATTILGCVALLDDDQESLEAVLADLESLFTDDSLSIQEHSKILVLLSAISSLSSSRAESNDSRLSELSRANNTIMLSPSQPHGWSQLTAISGDEFPAEIAILVASKAVAPKGSIEASDLCKAYAGSGRPNDAQRATMIAPFSDRGWEALY